MSMVLHDTPIYPEILPLLRVALWGLEFRMILSGFEVKQRLMKLSRQEEYGLRCMLQLVHLAPDPSDAPVSTEQISEGEGLGYEHTAKIMRLLRQGGLVESTRGASGGFTLARPAHEISVWEILVCLDQPLYGQHFCDDYSGRTTNCVHTNACTLRGLWSWVNNALQQTLSGLSLADLAAGQSWPEVPAPLELS